MYAGGRGVARSGGDGRVVRRATHDHVGGLQVQVHGVLLVQGVRGGGDGGAQGGQRLNGQPLMLLGDAVQPVVQRGAGHVLHHHIRRGGQITHGDQARHVRAAERLQDLVLHLEADDGLGAIARRHARHLHHHRERRGAAVGVGHFVDVGHAATVQALAQLEFVQHHARGCLGRSRAHRPTSSRSAKKAGSGVARMASAAACTS